MIGYLLFFFFTTLKILCALLTGIYFLMREWFIERVLVGRRCKRSEGTRQGDVWGKKEQGRKGSR